MARGTASALRCTVVALAGVGLAGCYEFFPPPAVIDVAAGLQADVLMFGGAEPSAMAATDDGRLFYTERDTGRIRVIKDGVLLAAPFAEVPVNTAGERGLLGIALHPRFQDNGRIYVFYSRSDTGQVSSDAQAIIDNRIVYFEGGNDSDTASGGEVFVSSLPVSANAARIGGALAFLPDRTLLAGLGDLTSADLVQDNGTLYGKVLRYNDDGTIPADNPIAGSPVYARGVRAPRALAVDPGSGMPFLLDRGASGQFEIDRVVAGRDYGWPTVNGIADTPAEQAYVAANPEYTDPILDTGLFRAELYGLAFNPSGEYGPGPRWRLFYGEALEARVFSVELDTERTAVVGTAGFAKNFGPIRGVTFTPSGTLYVATQDAIFRVRTYAYPPPD